MIRYAVLYEGAPGLRVATPRLTLIGATAETLRDEAKRLVAEGATHVELCGGVDAETAAAVRADLDRSVGVGLCRYDFGSLEKIAEFKVAFSAGRTVGRQYFLVPASTGAAEVVHEDVTILPVEDLRHAEEIGRRVGAEQAGLVELYAGLGVEAAAALRRGSGGSVPVGFVS